MRLGARTYGHAFGWLLIAAYVALVPVALLVGDGWPLLPVVTLPLLASVARRSREAARTDGAVAKGAAYVVALGATARLQLAFGATLTLGLVLSATLT